MSKQKLKKMLREKGQYGAVVELYKNLQTSSKVRNIKYNKLELQDYLKSKLTKEERNMITAIRSKCVREIKTNFGNMYKGCQHCPMKCDEEAPNQDTQEHILTCEALGGSTADINFMYAGSVDQRLLGKEFLRLMLKRAQLLEGVPTSRECCRLPGALLDQSTSQQGGAAVTQSFV